MSIVRLSTFENSWYRPGPSRFVQALWFFAGLPLLRCTLLPSSSIRVLLLRLFGARIGTGVVIRPGVRVKYPWNLTLGNHCWIGEDSWIDNLASVSAGNDVCISQGAYLCTGNHDWSDPSFGLIVRPICIEDGAWVGARAVLAPGVNLGVEAIAGLGSVVTRSIPSQEIHAGNPATFIAHRKFRNQTESSRLQKETQQMASAISGTP
jgi:putative colanic acid biosynthesis acetyltransferase WcaF